MQSRRCDDCPGRERPRRDGSKIRVDQAGELFRLQRLGFRIRSRAQIGSSCLVQSAVQSAILVKNKLIPGIKRVDVVIDAPQGILSSANTR